MNLATGRWVPLAVSDGSTVTHDSKPWAAFWRNRGKFRRQDEVTVVDLVSGSKLFEWKSENRAGRREKTEHRPFFVGDDRLAIRVEVEEGGGDPSPQLQIWSIPTGRLIGTHALKIRWDLVSSARVLAWYDAVSRNAMLLDLSSGLPLHEVRGDWPGVPNSLFGGGLGGGLWATVTSPLAFSADGRSLLIPGAGGLFDVETGRSIWKAAAGAGIAYSRPPHRFEVYEPRELILGSWSKSLTTFAVRSLDSGSLIYRTWKMTLSPYAADESGSLVVLDQSDVYELPPHVNYPLLALCQTILALPLILLWSILRWRRARRLASVSP